MAMEFDRICQFWWRNPHEKTKIFVEEPRKKMDMCTDNLSKQVKDGLQHVRNGYTVLHFNYHGMRELPHILFTDTEFSHIKRIHLKRNRLIRLPDAIDRLTNLTELYLHSNDIECLPDSIGNLKNLESLDLSNNNLRSLPDAITDLESLNILAVSNNNVQCLPKGLNKMKSLRVLDMMSNHLRYLPLEVIHCPNLKRLLLDRNHLTWLPKQLCHMTKLEELSAAGNDLLALPLDLGNIPTLKTVYVDNNRSLHTVPISLQNKEIGFNSCGRLNFEASDTDHRSPITVTIPHDNGVKVICLPPEILEIGSRERAVPSLLELSLRQAYKQNHKIAMSELPRNLQRHLQGHTASCFTCQSVVFTSGFPLVFEGQVRLYSVHYLAMCCSVKCFRTACLLIQLPLVYPDPVDIDMAVALVQ